MLHGRFRDVAGEWRAVATREILSDETLWCGIVFIVPS